MSHTRGTSKAPRLIFLSLLFNKFTEGFERERVWDREGTARRVLCTDLCVIFVAEFAFLTAMRFKSILSNFFGVLTRFSHNFSLN